MTPNVCVDDVKIGIGLTQFVEDTFEYMRFARSRRAKNSEDIRDSELDLILELSELLFSASERSWLEVLAELPVCKF